MSVNSTDPGTLFGGSWQRIQDRFLLAAGTSYSAGSTGGEAKHTLTVNEMPSHTHTFSMYESGQYGKFPGSGQYTLESGIETNATGGGAAHNNMPPYLAVYVWKRVA